MSTAMIHQPATAIVPNSVDQVLTLAKLMAESGVFSDARDAPQAAVKILAGREMGFGPFQSMAGIHIVKGKPTMSANLIAAAIRRSGRYDFRVKQHDDQKCVIEFTMDRQPIGVSIFTIEDAKKAGLASNDNYRKYPKNMLYARAMSNGAKWHCPDVFGGPVYTPDELGAIIDPEEGTVIDVSPEPVKVLPAKITITSEQREELEQLIRRKGADAARLLSYYEVESLSDLTPKQHAHAIERLSGRPDVSEDSQSMVPADSECTNQ